MNEDWLAGRFEGNRPRLLAMAYRMLGSDGDAQDALQEAWIHVAGADAESVANLDGWFTTITARVCLDMLRSRKSRREETVDEPLQATTAPGPEQEAMLADSVGLALLVVLDTLAPAERVAFVLHDMFGVPFGDIAEITGRSPDAARQLASRARRRVRDGEAPTQAAQVTRQRAVAEAFLAASRAGDFEALLAVLDPDVVLHADAAAVPAGRPSVLVGATAVARNARLAAGRSRQAAVALIDGTPGIVWAPGGRLSLVLAFTFRDDKISGIEIIAEPAGLERLRLAVPGQ